MTMRVVWMVSPPQWRKDKRQLRHYRRRVKRCARNGTMLSGTARDIVGYGLMVESEIYVSNVMPKENEP